MVSTERIVKSYIKMYFQEGILHAAYLPGAFINLEVAKLLIKERIEFCEGKDYPVLIDLRNLKGSTKEAREYFSNSPEGSQNIIAGAFIIGSFPSKMMGNFYLKINPPPRPTKLFTNEREAINWLKNYLNN